MIDVPGPPTKDLLQTYTGRVIKPMDAWPGDFDIEDIAWSLAMQCRYNGHTQLFYSVATHSILVARFLPQHLKLEGLLHDASEAYLCDLPSPVKRIMPEYQKVEAALEAVIAAQYHLTHPMDYLVKRADDYVFQLECGLVMGGKLADKYEIPTTDCSIKEYDAVLRDKKEVEETIEHCAGLHPSVVSTLFLNNFNHFMKTRGADIQAAQEMPNADV